MPSPLKEHHPASIKMKKPILVHIHLFYTDMWPEIKECLRNLEGRPHHLYITLLKTSEAIIPRLLSEVPHAQIRFVENRGYDIAPFLSILNEVNLGDYSFILKLHTKRDCLKSPYFRNLYGNLWRQELLRIISSKEAFHRCLEVFEKEPQTGMLASAILHVFHDIYDKKSMRETRDFLRDKGHKPMPFGFIAGTMFLCRAHLMQPLKVLALKTEDFAIPDKAHTRTLAHVVERLFGYFVYAQGYRLRDASLSRIKQIQHALIWRLKEIAYITLKTLFIKIRETRYTDRPNKRTIKILRIPIYVKHLPPEKEDV
jgi:lipopolysaccharide biosynthesis protein